MPRQARLDSPGTLHHVMIRGIERCQIVGGVKDRKEFVERMGTLAEETVKRQLPPLELAKRVGKMIEKACAKAKISREVLLSSSRRHYVSAVRAELARTLVKEVGISLAECARQLGVTTSGIAQILRRQT